MSKKIKILFVKNITRPFIEKDVRILKKHFDVRVVYFILNLRNLKGTLLTPFKMIKGVLWSDLTFSRFADIHAFWAVLLSKIFKKKSIVVVGGFDVANIPEIKYGLLRSPIFAYMVKFVLKNADKVLPNDESLKIDAIKNVKVNGKNIQIVYNGYDSNKWKFEGEKEDLVMTVSVGTRWKRVRLKGLDIFVESAKFLSDVKFLVIGVQGDALKKLQDIAPSNVKFIGPLSQDELISYYQKAKVYCQLSMREGLPNALCEAMLCECVPVGTKRGGIPTVIGDAGFYVQHGNPKATAEAIKKALNSDKGKAARERIKSNFPLEKREKELINIINQLLEKSYFVTKLYKGQSNCLTDMKGREKKQKLFYKNEYHKIFTPEDIEKRAYSKLYQDKLDWIMNFFMKNKNNKRILDVGCGFGRVSIPLAKKTNNTIIGLDISLTMLKNAKKNVYCDEKTITDLHFILGDAETLPLKDKSVDYVISLDITPHLINTIDHLKELKRITKQDGSILVDFSNKNLLWTLAYPRFILYNLLFLNCYHLFFKQKLLFKHRKKTSDFERQDFPYSKKEAEGVLSIAGLRSNHWIKFGLTFAPKFLLACIKIQKK